MNGEILTDGAGNAAAVVGLEYASMVPVLYRIEFDEVAGCCVGLKPVGPLPPCGPFPVPRVGAVK